MNRNFGRSPLAALAAIWRATARQLWRARDPRKDLRVAVHEEMERLWTAREEVRDEDWMPPDLAVLEFPTGARAFIPLPGNEKLVERLLAGGIGAIEIGHASDPATLERMMGRKRRK